RQLVQGLPLASSRISTGDARQLPNQPETLAAWEGKRICPAPRAARCPRARLERQTVCGADRLSAENETIQSTDPRAKKLRVSRGIGALSQSGAPIPRGARLANGSVL